MNTIEELYYGTIQPNLNKNINNKNFDEAVKIAEESEQKLLEMLNENQRKIFNEILTANSQIIGETEISHFIMGFKLGAKFAIDTFLDDDILALIEQ